MFYDIAANVLLPVDNEPTITPDIGLLSESIEKLNLRNNFIGGTIPTSIGSLILLKEFDVSYNRLRGLQPDSLLQNITGLEGVRVGHNLLNGTISELRLALLKELRLSFNGSSYFCEDVSEWRDGRWGKFDTDYYDADDYVFSCLWYEEWDEPGCPLYGDKWPDGDGVTASEACCHCGYDSNSTPSVCHDYNGWIDVYGGGCDVYEFYDDPACPQYGSLFPNDDGISGNEACCYCGGGSLKFPSLSPTSSVVPSYKYEPSVIPSTTPSDTRPCYDYIGWIDTWGYGCDLYELYDDPGCPIQGPLWANDDNITGSEACCYCGGGFFEFPSSSPTKPSSYSPTVSQVPSHKYEPSSIPSITPTNAPPCYNYIGWVDSYNDGCEWYEAYDQPGCPNHGLLAENDDGVSAVDACCSCGGGFLEFPTVSPTTTQVPSYKYEPSTRPSSQCYDYIGWMETHGGTCGLYEDESNEGYFDDPGCPNHGGDNNIHGITANEGCCYCGGGFSLAAYDDFIPYECDDNSDNWRNIVSGKDISGDYESCSVLDFYFNMSTRNEQAYYDLLNDYCNLLHNGTIFMNEACCICKTTPSVTASGSPVALVSATPTAKVPTKSPVTIINPSPPGPPSLSSNTTPNIIPSSTPTIISSLSPTSYHSMMPSVSSSEAPTSSSSQTPSISSNVTPSGSPVALVSATPTAKVSTKSPVNIINPSPSGPQMAPPTSSSSYYNQLSGNELTNVFWGFSILFIAGLA